ncbi:phosphoheptose isomerase [Chthonomonas calidirosea]|uniref:Phosphoheptose isomerase n=1 Tax=Chthonomonas calidirosea (strain DSM 23976 / ICMP 18418 / T49) TaxID=1303518 RepID=S0EVD7_CHTCT|nr:D-sedoheptulose 7-phosphate isomerase [Chthonomonas calidirosea]CCW35375.1 phosphoheptose isomerase [Chthonomonas calidirosea T49]CEK20461.1 phosphoheptose isomerase [Chthonomonas calidirosea]
MTQKEGSSSRQTLARTIAESMAVKERLFEACSSVFEQLVEATVSAFSKGNKMLLCGNGGSACDAQHVAGELVGRFLKDRHPLPAIALSAADSILTCVGNDYSFADVFARQVQALAQPGDIVVGISTSGNSPNVIRAIEVARQCQAVCVGFTGAEGGKLREITDICLCVPSQVTARIQEAHITLWHALCEEIENRLFGS